MIKLKECLVVNLFCLFLVTASFAWVLTDAEMADIKGQEWYGTVCGCCEDLCEAFGDLGACIGDPIDSVKCIWCDPYIGPPYGCDGLWSVCNMAYADTSTPGAVILFCVLDVFEGGEIYCEEHNMLILGGLLLRPRIAR